MASSGLVSGAMVHASKCRLGTRQGMQSPTGLLVWEIHRPTIGLSGRIGRHAKKRAIKAGRCREWHDADHIFIQIYFRMHHFNVKFSKISSPQAGDLSCFLQRQTDAATFALPGQSSDATRVISAWWQQHLPSLPPTTYICHFCVFGMQATAVVKKTRSTDSKRDR